MGWRCAALLSLLLVTSGCSEKKTDNESSTCADVPCDGAAVSLAVGVSEPDGFNEFVDGQSVSLVFGPQGGQHFYADLLLASPTQGQWDFALYFDDELSGETIGYSEEHARACPCKTLMRQIPVIVKERATQTGRLSVLGTEREHGQTVASAPVRLQALLP